MITPNFKLPKTKMTVVVWHRGELHETLIPTPSSCSALGNVMFNQHRVGPSEIRALKSVEPTEMLGHKF